MNKERRKQIGVCLAAIYEQKDILEELLNEEEEYRDNIPENMQGGEKYEAAEEAINYIEEAIAGLDEAIDNLEGI